MKRGKQKEEGGGNYTNRQTKCVPSHEQSAANNSNFRANSEISRVDASITSLHLILWIETHADITTAMTSFSTHWSLSVRACVWVSVCVCVCVCVCVSGGPRFNDLSLVWVSDLLGTKMCRHTHTHTHTHTTFASYYRCCNDFRLELMPCGNLYYINNTNYDIFLPVLKPLNS